MVEHLQLYSAAHSLLPRKLLLDKGSQRSLKVIPSSAKQCKKSYVTEHSFSLFLKNLYLLRIIKRSQHEKWFSRVVTVTCCYKIYVDNVLIHRPVKEVCSGYLLILKCLEISFLILGLKRREMFPYSVLFSSHDKRLKHKRIQSNLKSFL